MVEPVDAASVDAWFDAYGSVYAAVPHDPHRPCPNCGQDSLHLLFWARRGLESGTALFWCSSCHLGLRISRARLPDGARVVLFDEIDQDPASNIPEFTDVQAL